MGSRPTYTPKSPRPFGSPRTYAPAWPSQLDDASSCLNGWRSIGVLAPLVQPAPRTHPVPPSVAFMYADNPVCTWMPCATPLDVTASCGALKYALIERTSPDL